MSLDVVSVALYDRDGDTLLHPIPDATVTWQEELSKPGSATVRMPVGQATGLADRTVLKFSLGGQVRFGCRVTAERTQLAVDNLASVQLELSSQPGLLSLLGDAVVLPEYGVARVSAAERVFGFMSKQGGWYSAGDWSTPVGYAFSADTLRTGYPPALAASNPMWIGAVSPATPQPVGTSWYFRREFTVATAQNVSIMFSADNFLTLYLDGQQIVSPDPADNHAYRNVFTVPARLAAGPHILAAQVTNANGGTSNPMGLIGTVFTLDPKGTPNGNLLKTDTAWKVNNGSPTVPGWRRAQVLKTLVTEAAARGVAGAAALSLGFGDVYDSAGQPWTDTPDDYAFPIYTNSLVEVVDKLGEADIDVTVDAATMTLQAWKRRGTDRSASVALQLGHDDGSLTNYETTAGSARFTAVGAQLANGTWTEVLDSAGVAAYGRIETGLALGSSEQSATHVARAQLLESAKPLLAITGETSSLVGPQPYSQYHLGDTISVPGHRGGTPIKARVIAISVDGATFPLRAWPELVRDDSATNGGIPPRRLPPTGAQRFISKLKTLADKVTTAGVGTGTGSGGSGTNGGGYGGDSGSGGGGGGGGTSGPQPLAIVNHGSTANTPRPDCVVAYWIGIVTPTNALAYDFWYDGNI